MLESRVVLFDKYVQGELLSLLVFAHHYYIRRKNIFKSPNVSIKWNSVLCIKILQSKRAGDLVILIQDFIENKKYR